MNAVTHQQECYEQAYLAASGAGFPDAKITDGMPVADLRILTLGGGTANDLWHLAARNLVVNADYAVSGLKASLQNGVPGVSVNLNSFVALPFPDQMFDLVVCKDILEHLLEPLATLRQAVRVLRPGGQILINVPNQFYLLMRLGLLFGRGLIWRGLLEDHSGEYHEWDYMHIRFFTYKGFRQFLAAAGLKPVKFYWDFGGLAYYHNPDRWFAPQLRKRAAGLPLSRRAKFGIYLLRPLWRLFNFVFPQALRSAMVSIFPGLLSASFYVRCEKQ